MKHLRSQHGFTVVEMLVSATLSLVVLAAVYSIFISQWRAAAFAQEQMSSRETLRGAAALLTWEMRALSASRGDLYALLPQSVKVRSVTATGTVCAVHTSQPRYGLWRQDQTLLATANDSVAIYKPTGGWSIFKVTQVWGDPSAAGIAACQWSPALVPDVAFAVAPGDTAGIVPGSAAFGFRTIEYGIFSENGRWWLGRRQGTASAYELVTGPLAAPADSGFLLHYFDAAGAETTTAADVRRIRVTLRSESAGKVHDSGGDLSVRADSVHIQVTLRN